MKLEIKSLRMQVEGRRRANVTARIKAHLFSVLRASPKHSKGPLACHGNNSLFTSLQIGPQRCYCPLSTAYYQQRLLSKPTLRGSVSSGLKRTEDCEASICVRRERVLRRVFCFRPQPPTKTLLGSHSGEALNIRWPKKIAVRLSTTGERSSVASEPAYWLCAQEIYLAQSFCVYQNVNP